MRRHASLILVVFACIGFAACTSAGGSTPDADTSGLDVSEAVTTDAREDGVDADAGPCVEGARACLADRTWSTICAEGHVQRLKHCTPGTICLSGQCLEPTPCEPGAPGPCPSPLEASTCDASGLGYVPSPCGPDELCA